MCVFLLVFAMIVFFAPNLFGEVDNYVRANPLQTPNAIVPEWYFLPFYAILRSVPDKLAGVLAMFGSILIWFILPWLDTSPVRSARFRPVYRVMMWLLPVDMIILGVVGHHHPEPPWILIGRPGDDVVLPAFPFAADPRLPGKAAAAAREHQPPGAAASHLRRIERGRRRAAARRCRGQADGEKTDARPCSSRCRGAGRRPSVRRAPRRERHPCRT